MYNDDVHENVPTMFEDFIHERHQEELSARNACVTIEDVGNPDVFAKLIEDRENDLYRGCTRFTKFSILIYLFHIRNLCSWINKSFGMVLDLFNETFLL